MPKPSSIPLPPPAMERDKPSVCPECHSDDIVEDWMQGTADCRGCGLVLAERILDLGLEKRVFEDDSHDPSRVGAAANPLLDGADMTEIGGENGGGALGRTQRRNAISVSDRQLLDAFKTTDNYITQLNVPKKVSNRAKELFKGYLDYATLRPDGSRSRSLRKDETNEMIAAALFIACRNERVARSYKEISGVTKVLRKTAGAAVKKLESAVKGAKMSSLPNTQDFVSRYCARLGLPYNITKQAEGIAKALYKGPLSSKSYTTVAATAIYAVTQLCDNKEYKKTPSQVSKATGVGEVTIRISYKKAKEEDPQSIVSVKKEVPVKKELEHA